MDSSEHSSIAVLVAAAATLGTDSSTDASTDTGPDNSTDTGADIIKRGVAHASADSGTHTCTYV